MPEPQVLKNCDNCAFGRTDRTTVVCTSCTEMGGTMDNWKPLAVAAPRAPEVPLTVLVAPLIRLMRSPHATDDLRFEAALTLDQLLLDHDKR